MKRASQILFYIVLALVIFNTTIKSSYAVPVGPTITVLGNSTKSADAATKVNSTNGTQSPGGYIFVLYIDSRQQNTRWKAYVGNVTGTLALDDSSENTLFQWSLTSVAGEVYATRASGDINWSGINCTWIADGRTNAEDGFENSNRSPEHDENVALSHENINDNITATFVNTNHSSIRVGDIVIGKDECFTVQTWQNGGEQSFSDSDNANFTQVLLYDGAFNKLDGNIVYATEMEQDETGYRDDSTYDFQMIVPEDASLGFSGSTAYYFYVELT